MQGTTTLTYIFIHAGRHKKKPAQKWEELKDINDKSKKDIK